MWIKNVVITHAFRVLQTEIKVYRKIQFDHRLTIQQNIVTYFVSDLFSLYTSNITAFMFLYIVCFLCTDLKFIFFSLYAVIFSHPSKEFYFMQ